MQIKSIIFCIFISQIILTNCVYSQQANLYSFVDSIYGILTESKKNFEKGVAYLNMMNVVVECDEAISIYDRTIPLFDSSYKMILQIDTIRKIMKCKSISVNDSLIRNKFGNNSTGDLEVDYAIILDNIERYIQRCKEISGNLKDLLHASKGQSAWRMDCKPYKLGYDDHLMIKHTLNSYLALEESIQVYLEKIKICKE